MAKDVIEPENVSFFLIFQISSAVLKGIPIADEFESRVLAQTGLDIIY